MKLWHFITFGVVSILVLAACWAMVIHLVITEGPQIAGQVAAQVHNAYAKEAK